MAFPVITLALGPVLPEKVAMSGIVSNLVRGAMAVAFAFPCTTMAQSPAVPLLSAQVPADDGGLPAPTPADQAADALPPDGAAPPAPSTLPSDAISSAANPPDEAPAADAPPPAATPPSPAPDISVTSQDLLLTQIDDSGVQTVTPATAIPYVVGKSCYSWDLHYAPAEGDLTLSEELVLPGPARTWDATPADRTTVNPQGSGAITERHFDAATGTASAGWCVAPSDPVGSYRYIIRQGEREVARFDFTVGDLL